MVRHEVSVQRLVRLQLRNNELELRNEELEEMVRHLRQKLWRVRRAMSTEQKVLWRHALEQNEQLRRLRAERT